MKLCRNCTHWQSIGNWQGHCTVKHPEWVRYSQDADAGDCQDYEDKLSKYQNKEAVCQKQQ